MSRLSYTEREIAERIISGLSEALVTARTEARKAALEEAAAYHDRRAQDFRVFAEYTGGEAKRQAERAAELHEKSATAIRALIGTDPTTDRGEG